MVPRTHSSMRHALLEMCVQVVKHPLDVRDVSLIACELGKMAKILNVDMGNVDDRVLAQLEAAASNIECRDAAMNDQMASYARNLCLPVPCTCLEVDRQRDKRMEGQKGRAGRQTDLRTVHGIFIDT